MARLPPGVPWLPGYLPGAAPFRAEPKGGVTRLTTADCPTNVAVVEAMLAPILDAQGIWSEGTIDRSTLLRYNLFRVGLGQLRPTRVDDVWDPKALHYNAFLSSLVTRAEYYRIQKETHVDVAVLTEWCSKVWAATWECGDVMAGDESIVPHKGKRAGGIRQFIARKPHNTGIKLFCLCDTVAKFVFDVYLYSGRLNLRNESNWAGKLSNTKHMKRWDEMLPPGVCIMADSAFGTHNIAREFAALNRPFVLLTSRNAHMVEALSEGLQDGDLHTVHSPSAQYMTQVFKNPPVGKKAARCVPFLTNCKFAGGQYLHTRGYHLHPIVHKYRTRANGVDGANQMALQLRELGRKTTWSAAVRSFLLRQGMVNAFTTCKQLGLCRVDMTMADWQHMVMRDVHATMPARPDNLHVPVRLAGDVRRECQECGNGRVQWECCGCGRALHINCFAPAHGL
jgi:hypothetical protein